MGVFVATSPEITIQKDIPNPFVKPYITVGRKYTDPNYYEGSIDVDLYGFAEQRKISRMHAQVRFNPNTKKIEFKAIGRNDILLNGLPLKRMEWTPISETDILAQLNSNITFSVIYEQIPNIPNEIERENIPIIL